MIGLLTIIVILTFIVGISFKVTGGLSLVGILFIFMICVAAYNTVKNDLDYNKDIRQETNIQYNNTQIGKVDSILYIVNGDTINANQVNKIVK